MIYYMNKSGVIYTGDMQPGDRVATEEEVRKLFGNPVDIAIAAYKTNIQTRLDDFARSRNYDDVTSCVAKYYNSPVEKFRAEAHYMNDAVSYTWATAYEILAEILPAVEAGGDIPSWEEIEAQLPPLAWPEVTP